jgi:hypothetical protein
LPVRLSRWRRRWKWLRDPAVALRTAAIIGLLTSRIGNTSLPRLESGFPAITEPLLDHDYYLMATYWEEPQPNWRADDSAAADCLDRRR